MQGFEEWETECLRSTRAVNTTDSLVAEGQYCSVSQMVLLQTPILYHYNNCSNGQPQYQFDGIFRQGQECRFDIDGYLLINHLFIQQ